MELLGKGRKHGFSRQLSKVIDFNFQCNVALLKEVVCQINSDGSGGVWYQ